MNDGQNIINHLQRVIIIIVSVCARAVFWDRISTHPSIFICPITNNPNANKRAVGQDSETTRVLNTALNTNKVL